jgi:hypothetical protein
MKIRKFIWLAMFSLVAASISLLLHTETGVGGEPNAIAEWVKIKFVLSPGIEAHIGCVNLANGYYERDRCLMNLSSVSNDTRPCRDVQTTRMKDRCYAKRAWSWNDGVPCLNLSSDVRRDSCLIALWLENGNFHVCKNLFSDNLRDACFVMQTIIELLD